MKKQASIKILVVGGGTGGHIFPALAIAAALKQIRPDTELLFVGAKGKMEMDRIPDAGYTIIGIDIAGYNRSSLLKNISLPLKLVKSYFQVKNILNSFRPDAVLGVGGYATLPVLRIAQAQGIPTFIHESNSLPGKSNKILGKKANKIFVAGKGMDKYFPAEKIIVSGNPVRNELTIKQDRAKSLEHFGLKENKSTVLVLGGSLGAVSINKAIAAGLEIFKKNDIQFIWQTGRNYSPDAAALEEENNHIWTNAFINRMEMAYGAADVVVSRAGALTIAELCVQGKAAILVPYPHAAEDHQTVNAMELVQQDAAIMIADKDAGEVLVPTLLDLLAGSERRSILEKNIALLAYSGADEGIAREILNQING